MTDGVRVGLKVFLGLLLMQLAWILVIPPYGGIDEIDHAYRAAGVAQGQWWLDEPSENGRGVLVTIPADIVDSAQAQCEGLEYNLPDNCRSVAGVTDGMATVATAAGSYHPLYYALLGWAGKPFAGDGVDYAMRAASSLLCSLLMGVAATCLALAGARRWARLGLLLAATPVLVYSTSLPAPNGLEMASAVSLWASLWALLSRARPARDAFFVVVVAMSASIEVTVRYLGPMWAGLTLITVGIFAGRNAIARTVREARGRVVAGVAAVALVTAASVAWIVISGITGTSEHRQELGADAQLKLGLNPLAWVFQIVAAFPRRNEAASGEVYASYMLAFAAFLVWAVATARGRRKGVLLGMAAFVVVFPILISYLTFDTQGLIWQGRYGLPFAVGLPMLAGIALDRADAGGREGPRLAMLSVGLLLVAHAASVIGVFKSQVERSIDIGADWNPPPVVLAVILTVGGLSVLASTLPVGWKPDSVRSESDRVTADA